MVNWPEGDLPRGGIDVHCSCTWNVGALRVVRLRGLSDNRRSRRRLAEAMVPSYTVVALDYCGDRIPGGPEYGFRDRTASAVLDGIDAICLDRPVLIRHSMGAATGGEGVTIASMRLRGAVTENPLWRDEAASTVVTSGTEVGSWPPTRTPIRSAWMHTVEGRTEAQRCTPGDVERFPH